MCIIFCFRVAKETNLSWTAQRDLVTHIAHKNAKMCINVFSTCPIQIHLFCLPHLR